MVKKLKINKKDHAYETLKRLNSLRLDQKHCDFVVKSGHEEIHAHKNVLSGTSEYFRAMLAHETKENQSGVVKIKEMDPKCVKKCIDFIYTGEASVQGVTHENLMHVAHLMQLTRLCDGVTLSLEENLNAESFFLTKKIANLFACKHLEDVCEKYARENFRLISVENGFKELETEYVSALIKSKETKASESAKCKALIIWASKKLDERGECFAKILEHLDLLKIPLGYRRYLIEKEPLVFLSNPCLKSLLISIMDKANVMAKDFAIGGDGINNAISVFDKATKTVQVFEPEQKRWTRMQEIPDEIVTKQYTAVVLNEHIYILMSDGQGHRLNYADRTATWARIADRTVTQRVAAVVFNGAIYAFCNRNNASKAVEWFSPTEGTWNRLDDRPKNMYEMCVVASQDSIYSIGGFNGSAVFNDFFHFNPSSSNWTTLHPIQTARRSAAAVELYNKIYIIGGSSVAANNPLRSVECYDVETEIWTTNSNTNQPRLSFCACVLGDKVYVVGGNGSGGTIEVLDPYENTWNVSETMTGKNIHDEAVVAVNMFN